jgi:predicted nuclease of predicted toxin-antitoxin system
MKLRFLLDQNLSPRTTQYLRELGLDAQDVREVGLTGKSDDVVYEYALKNRFVLITFDHEFGPLFISRRDLEGLIIVRIHPQTLDRVHKAFKEFFAKVTDEQIKHNLVVIEEYRFRIKKM